MSLGTWLQRLFKPDKLRPSVLPDHESGVRRVYSDSRGLEYRPLRTLEDARVLPDGTVIFEGDDGGQIYLTCPARLVTCSAVELEQLLIEVDALGWNDPSSARVYFERLARGSGVVGGLGGGVVTDGVWLHPEIESPRLRERVERTLGVVAHRS